VSWSVNQVVPLATDESRRSTREDVVVIGNSLQYINDLLRSMLDIHCALSQQITVKAKHVDVLNDIFNPVASMIYRRGSDFKVLIECPEQLVVMSDPLRLKQVVLNLAMNSAKFVLKGFIRLRALVEEGKLMLLVEDSGPGISASRRDHLFEKFQPSLDCMDQGTGVGLSLCKHLVDLLGGDISLDASYNSEVDGFPGTRFAIVLKQRPIYWGSNEDLDQPRLPHAQSMAQLTPMRSIDTINDRLEIAQVADEDTLPDFLSVLFVDDDFVLRKLFVRSVKRCRPNWVVCEAASGEAAIQLVNERGRENEFGLIFLDQYMASTQKQLLGTEATQLLRSKGVASLICGLSANSIEPQFVEAGADCFMLKPLPCEAKELTRELSRILRIRDCK
jgi:CheY-like chemotaxis protein